MQGKRMVTTLKYDESTVAKLKPSENLTDSLSYQATGKTEASVIKKVLRHEGIKRFIDIIGAIVGLVIFSPVLVLSIVFIHLSGSKKIFFKQERIGKFEKPFMLYKFTTMKDNAHIDGPLVSRAGDARITKIGKFLRMTSVNELPQFINVLKGEMSIVGPRPEVAKYVKYWSPEIKKKVLSIKPGITGYATTRYWKESEVLNRMNNFEEYYITHVMPEKLQLDLWYVDNWDLLLDIKIMFQTFYKAFNGDRREKLGQQNPEEKSGNVKTKRLRRLLRAPVDIVAYLEAGNKSVGCVIIRNISSGGVFIETDEPFQIGTKINLHFKLPNRSTLIKALCKVTWIKTKAIYKKTEGIGVQFVDIPAPEEAELKNYLESRFYGYV